MALFLRARGHAVTLQGVVPSGGTARIKPVPHAAVTRFEARRRSPIRSHRLLAMNPEGSQYKRQRGDARRSKNHSSFRWRA